MKSNPENIEDSECKIIINKKDYYEILGLKMMHLKMILENRIKN